MTQEEVVSISQQYERALDAKTAAEFALDKAREQFATIQKHCTHKHLDGRNAIERGYTWDTCSICGDMF